MLKWLDAREATEVGTALADDFVLQSAAAPGEARRKETRASGENRELQKFLQKFLQRVDRDARPLKLNVLKRAKLANSFKWRLLEKGVDGQLVDELTQALVVRLTAKDAAAAPGEASSPARKLGAKGVQALREQANENLNRGALTEAVASFQELLSFDGRDAFAHNGLGVAYARLTRYPEAEHHLRRAIGNRDGFAEAHYNLAGVLQSTGRYNESELPLRRALKLKPAYLDARISLGGTLTLIGHLAEARDCYEKALRVAPRNARAIVGLGQVEALEGHFERAEAAYRSALEIDPAASYALSAVAGLRRMSPADGAWLKRAEELASSGLAPLDEATMRFAIGKYCDDVGDFTRAFRSYQRANELQKMRAMPYAPASRKQFVDDFATAYTREALARAGVGASDSERPVFVVGMPRSGTSLVEQIIASHPSAHGAGELEFWNAFVHKHEEAVRQAVPEESTRKRLAAEYLRVLSGHSRDATRIVDKAPVNSDYLGLINTVFPRARMIYLRRDPIDTCLSCYFQQLSPVMNFTMDLADLNHYYREQQRLLAHWRSALPKEALLEVRYEDLVNDQETWTRRILEFLGLPWDERCLEFHKTERAVSTASTWQVRQKIYTSSVERWRNYEKFIKPLLSLQDLGP